LKKINVLGALAAPLVLFFLTSAGRADDAAAPTTCKDGTYSKSKVHTGSCSHHGGVAQFLTPGQ
jgi:hypothetical protein